jgi:hypothetical protein
MSILVGLLNHYLELFIRHSVGPVHSLMLLSRTGSQCSKCNISGLAPNCYTAEKASTEQLESVKCEFEEISNKYYTVLFLQYVFNLTVGNVTNTKAHQKTNF